MDHGFIILELFSLFIVSGPHECLQFPLSSDFYCNFSKNPDTITIGKKEMFMRFVKFLCCFVVICCSFDQLESALTETTLEGSCEISNKTYVSPESVAVLNGGIWLAYQGQWHQVPNLGSDAAGVYVAHTNEWEGHWVCPRCDTVNLFYHLHCRRCHRPK